MAEELLRRLIAAGVIYLDAVRLTVTDTDGYMQIRVSDEEAAYLDGLSRPTCTCPSGDGSLRWPCPVHG